MALSDSDIKEITRRLLLARMRILTQKGFFGLLLMNLKMSLDSSIETASVDSSHIVFNPEFVKNLSEKELDYCLLHLVLHVALKHCGRGDKFDKQTYDMASDIVVNSIILESTGNDITSIYLGNYGGIQPHMVPDGQEGALYSVEEVYNMLFEKSDEGNGWDNHDKLQDENMGADANEKALIDATWQQHIISAAKSIEEQDSVKGTGSLPAFVQRYLSELGKPKNDWRTILDEFIQEEICDYSFSPPDRRFGECEFFLPDFNDTDISIKNILFMVDTSGSMSKKEITDCYSEINGAIEQFGGKLEGWLGFFDADVTKPIAFSDVTDISKIIPIGGGGTSFFVIFDYIHSEMQDNPPSCIVILTDGYAEFPDEFNSNGIPVLWVINNEKITPPWGKIARI